MHTSSCRCRFVAADPGAETGGEVKDLLAKCTTELRDMEERANVETAGGSGSTEHATQRQTLIP